MTRQLRNLPRANPAVLLVTLLLLVGQTACTAMLLGGGGQSGSSSAPSSLAQSVSARIAADDMLSGQTIGVTANGSVVTLRGRVASQALKSRADGLARSVSGVTDVDNRLVIQAGT